MNLSLLNVLKETISHNSLFLSFSFGQPLSGCPHHLRSAVSLEWGIGPAQRLCRLDFYCQP